VSKSNELLAAIKKVSEEKKLDKIGSKDLIKAICEDEECPWATYNHGQPITHRQFSGLLRKYNITSKDLRFDDGRAGIKGFEIEQFTDAFSRYLPHPPKNAHFAATPLQTNNHAAYSVADSNNTAAEKPLNATPKPAPDNTCSAVADKKPISGGTEEEFSKTTHLRI
jgi:putative DNA primase/helicase